MINEEWNHEVESVGEQLIFILWLSVGVVGVAGLVLALAL
jgi:hypothetical protein